MLDPPRARLLAEFGREEPLGLTPEGPLADELNRPVEQAIVALAKRLHGKRGRAALERALLIAFDLPYGAVRRYLIAGKPPSKLRADLETAVRVLLEKPL